MKGEKDSQQPTNKRQRVADGEETIDRASSEGEAEPARSEKYYDPQGDLEILSSDGVLLKNYAYTMQAGSEVWRDLIAQASNSRVELSDPEFETAEVLNTLLHVLIKGALPKDLFWVHVVRVVKLGRKYAFDGLLKMIDYEARCCLYEKTGYSAYIMIVAANLDNLGLFVRAFNDVGKSRYALPDEAKFGDECTGARTIDPSTLALEDFRLVKSEVMWAWMRAYRVAFGSRDIDRQEEERLAQKAGKEFQRLMKLEGQYLAVLPDLNTIVDTVRCSEDAVVKVKGLHTDRRVSHCMEDTPGADQAGGI